MSVLSKANTSFFNYVNVLKPRETALLVFIGTCSALIAAASFKGLFPLRDFILTVIAIALGSAGANGLTNYLDREVDARMKRTCNRVLPSKKIEPAHKVLPLIILLILGGLLLAWILSPICFIIGVIGIIASTVWRKTVSCTIFGIIAGSAPILIGWYGITGQTDMLVPVLFFCLIAVWTPIHVWTLMMANRADYEGAGLHYFPLNWKDKDIIKVVGILSIALCFISLLIYFLTGKFHLLYLVIVGVLGALMIYAGIRLLISPTSKNAWLVFKLSAFPYLGIIFAVMALDAWLL